MNPVAPVTQTVTTSAWAICSCFRTLGAHRNPMPIRLLLLLAALSVVLLVPASAWAADYVPDEVIVHYENGTGGDVAAQVATEAGTEPLQSLPGGSAQLAIDDGDSVRETIAELQKNPNVAYAVPNWHAQAAAEATNDPESRLQWNLFGQYGINVVEAWTLAEGLGAPGGRGAVVAVIDSGVAYERRGRFRRAPDLYGGRFVKPYDFVERDRHPNDEESHGTHVAGTIAQKTNNRRGLTGLAYGVKIMPLRVLDAQGGGRASYISRAIRYAARHKADVINMSVEFDLLQKASGIPEVIAAMRYANKKGVVMVAASGNDFVNRVTYPARDPRVIAVGATTDNLCKADYSNTGTQLDIVAPGGGDDAPLDDNASDAQNCDSSSRGRGIVQETFTTSFRRFGLVSDQGTSFASPHVSAAAALLIATKRLGPDATPEQIAQRLKDTARDLGPAGADTRYGAGLLDAAAALSPDAPPAQGGTAAPTQPTTP